MALVGRETGAIEIRTMEEGGVRKKVRAWVHPEWEWG